MPDLQKLPRESHLTHAAYDEGAREMTVQFRNGDRGSYGNVTPDQWKAFHAADSYGSWLHSELRSDPVMHPFKKG